jgi:hypothetical protein
MEYLNIDEVTAASMAVIEEATQEDRNLFRAWVVECMKDIGPNSSWYKRCELKPKNSSLKKPADHTATVDIALFDSSDNELLYTYVPNLAGRVHPDRFALYDNVTDSTRTTKVDISEDAFFYHLGTNASLVDSALIGYLAMPVDRDGMPMVPENQLTAYKMFCRWNFAMRKNNNQSFIEQAYGMWLKERDRAKGRGKMPDPFRGVQIFKKYLSLVGTPKFN